jgi:hypothetical protein
MAYSPTVIRKRDLLQARLNNHDYLDMHPARPKSALIT